ncbi:MAG TPA: SHOCT domain-containing protein [Polyangiaceae bacterium]
MNTVWWLFWLVALVAFFCVAVPVRRSKWREYKEASPLAILQRRYALGEISTEQYEERKARLERDKIGRTTIGSPPRAAPPMNTTQGV